MIVENIDINLLKPYSNNPRKLTPKAIEKVAQSLKEFGFRQPIVVDGNNTIQCRTDVQSHHIGKTGCSE